MVRPSQQLYSVLPVGSLPVRWGAIVLAGMPREAILVAIPGKTSNLDRAVWYDQEGQYLQEDVLPRQPEL